MGLSSLQISAACFNVVDTLAGTKVACDNDAIMKLAHKIRGPEGLHFSMADFCGGYGLFAFHLTPDLDHSHWSPFYWGNHKVHGEFTA